MQEIKKLIYSENTSLKVNSFNLIYRANRRSSIKRWLAALLISLAIILILPWTQNIRAKGNVTTLRQESRPQELNSVIAGKIIKWYVKEGDTVSEGDTIAQLAEVKDNYLDPALLLRTQEQMDAKSSAIKYYGAKVEATGQQISAMKQAMQLKIQQLNNKAMQLQLKVTGDSMEAVAANNDLRIASEQYRRQKIMFDSGLASMVQLEQRNQSYQNAIAKKVSAEVKFSNTKTDLTNVRIELNQVQQDYAEKIYKATGEQAASQSEIATGTGELSKLNNQLANYRIRAGQYYLIAPQSGQIVKAEKAGINEIVKEGEKLLEIVPVRPDYAVEIFVKPVDLPLLSRGQKLRLFFDGYPAIVFSGWPGSSYGTFGGKVTAIENSVSSNGKFRVLVAPDGNKVWPTTLRLGTGASSIILLKDVAVWYEIWRNINGFPPDYYQPYEKEKKDKDKEKNPWDVKKKKK